MNPALRVPFTVIDEAVHLLDGEVEPWSIQLEVRVSGRLEEQRLRQAVGRALAAHPMARARKAPSPAPAARLEWEIVAEPDLDPLRVVECPDDASLAAVRAGLQSQFLPLAEAPPLRLRLTRHPGGDLLMMNLKHAASDAYGGLRILRSVARAYAGQPDPSPDVDFLETRSVEALLRAPDPETARRRTRTLLEKLRDLADAPARIAPEGGSRRPGYGLHHVRLPPETTAALARLEHPGTINDLLLAGLHLAIEGWNAEHAARSGRISTLVPVNLRPKQWWEEVAGNFTLMVRMTSAPEDRTSPAGALAAITEQTRRMKKGGTAAALIELLARAGSIPYWAKRPLPALLTATGGRLVDTVELSNLGDLKDPPSFGPDAGETTEVWFSPPARMPLGLSVGIATVGGRLQLALRYRHPQFGPRAAERFAALYAEVLESFREESVARTLAHTAPTGG